MVVGAKETRHTRGFCAEAILMDAGLIQLPAMIASVVGVRDTKTPSCSSWLRHDTGGQSFETGSGFKKQSFKPRSFWHHTHLSLSLSVFF